MERAPDVGDHACPQCGLAGPTEVLDRIAALDESLRRYLGEPDERVVKLRGLLAELVSAMEWWGAQEDGVPDEAFDSFARARMELCWVGDGAFHERVARMAELEGERVSRLLRDPRVVLDAAEKILREADVARALLSRPVPKRQSWSTVVGHTKKPFSLEAPLNAGAESLADAFAAYAKLREGDT
jgi:hypothetical protein